jgi:transposase
MTLADYLKLDGRSATALAAKCGVGVSTITRAANGDTLPGRALMASLFEHTDGMVTPNDFFGIAAAPTDAQVAA